jgi:hypothetical protein
MGGEERRNGATGEVLLHETNNNTSNLDLYHSIAADYGILNRMDMLIYFLGKRC